MFGAGTYAILRAPKIFDRGQERGHRYTIFADSTAAINRARPDAAGPDQQLGQSGDSRDNEVTTFWVPANARKAGNEEADRCAKEAAEGRTHEVADEYRW